MVGLGPSLGGLMPTTLHASPGVNFFLEVTDCASSGYLWRLADDSSDAVILVDDGLVVSSLNPDIGNLRIGDTLCRTLTFMTKTAGVHILRLRMDRPWLNGQDDTGQISEWQVIAA